jgi:tRNA threonylcarbamoyladenosine dehydratase
MDAPYVITTYLEDFLRDHPTAILIDGRESQLSDLFLVKRPEMVRLGLEAFSTDDYRRFAESIVFNYIYFPWIDKVVAVLPEEDYYLLKTNRNKPLLSSADQQKLRDFRVAIIGLSVGSNVAHALGLMGGCNILLCDHDSLECANFNRLLGGIDEAGLKKAELVARRLYGNNPYAKLDVRPMKATIEFLEEYHHAHKLNLIVEEIDSLDMKIEIRKWAKKRGVGVIMLTSNVHGLILDVERYDLNNQLPILGRTEKFWNRLFMDCNQSMQKRLEIIYKIVDPKDMDPRMHRATAEIGKTVATWPQLVTAGMMEGSIGAATVLNIATGKDNREMYRKKISPIR